MKLDVTFDFRSDTPDSCDPDFYSPTLRRYHKVLWSRTLPTGEKMELEDDDSAYLCADVTGKHFRFSSDSIIPTYSGWKRQPIAGVVSETSQSDIDNFQTQGYTIGGMIIFPSNKVDGLNTINMARGRSASICDRFDLTLECIRRWYLGEDSPLFDTLSRYRDFLDLFQDFRGYVECFLLQDMVNLDYKSIRFMKKFIDFSQSPLPQDVDEYHDYMTKSLAFVKARNTRIDKFMNEYDVTEGILR